MPGATYPSAAAVHEALAVAVKRLGHGVAVTADPPQRRLYDPAVLGVRRTSDPTTHARGVWWVEVHARPGRSTVPCSSTTAPAAVVQDLDLVEQVDRVVCDDHNDITVLDLPVHDRTSPASSTGPPAA